MCMYTTFAATKERICVGLYKHLIENMHAWVILSPHAQWREFPVTQLNAKLQSTCGVKFEPIHSLCCSSLDAYYYTSDLDSSGWQNVLYWPSCCFLLRGIPGGGPNLSGIQSYPGWYSFTLLLSSAVRISMFVSDITSAEFFVVDCYICEWKMLL